LVLREKRRHGWPANGFLKRRSGTECLAFSLKQQACPHCGRRGALNRHSVLRGNAPAAAQGAIVRGQRAYCSARGKRGGCGRTFAFFFAGVLPRHSVTSALLTRLFAHLLGGQSLKAAAEALRSPFVLETFYRLRRRTRARLDLLRAQLHREQPPPPCAHGEPWLQTLAHLRAVFAGEADWVSAFQRRFQRPFLS
jgi:hypothetical protein